jgi:hypothetical protein
MDAAAERQEVLEDKDALYLIGIGLRPLASEEVFGEENCAAGDGFEGLLQGHCRSVSRASSAVGVIDGNYIL